MDFRIGYNVKPKEITNTKKVIFEKYKTGGEAGSYIDVLPTKNECEAYGFIYTGGKCRVIIDNTELIPFKSTIQAGKRNYCYGISDDSMLVGIDNSILSNSYNNLVVGNFNYVNELVNNSATIGAKADTTATNSIVLGGNAPADNLGERQSITLMYGGTTNNDVSTPLYLNNILNKYFDIPINTAMIFNADILGLRVGGTGAGALGDYASWIERGVIINKNGVISVSTTNTPIVSNGTTTGWLPSSALPTNSELVINGDFAKGLSGWAGNRDTTLAIVNKNQLDIKSARDKYGAAFSSVSFVVGKSYEIKLTVVSCNNANHIRVGTTTSAVGYSQNIWQSGDIGIGSFSTIYTPTTYGNYLSIGGRNDVTTLVISSVSVKEVIPHTGTNYNINVVGAKDTNIEWASTIRFTQIKTVVTL